MKREEIKLSQVQVNSANPRTISDEKFTKLVNSILVFPKMLELRPIVLDEAMVALGGNMRYRALTFIEGLSTSDLRARLAQIRDYQKKTTGEKESLVEYWERWEEQTEQKAVLLENITQ